MCNWVRGYNFRIIKLWPVAFLLLGAAMSVATDANAIQCLNAHLWDKQDLHARDVAMHSNHKYIHGQWMSSFYDF